MGSAVSNIASGIGNNISNSTQNMGSYVSRSPGQVWSDISASGNQLANSKNIGDVVNSSGSMASATGAPIIGDIVTPIGDALGATQPSGAPGAPGVDPGLAAVQQQQVQQAQSFRKNLPQYENTAYQSLAQAGNKQLGQNLSETNKYNNSRGLLFGGVNAGMRAGQRANTATQLAKGRSDINDKYQQAANQMDYNAINTGSVIQQSQQAIQDQIYNQALTNMMNQSNANSQLLQGAATVAAVALL